jgi:CRISPR-associated protein Csd2
MGSIAPMVLCLPKLAERTGFSEADLDLLREALITMFEHDRSAARGQMATRKAIAFKHENALGNAPAHALFERVRIGRNIDGEYRKIDRRLDNYSPAREFSDYSIEIDREGLKPKGVEIIDWL